MHAVFQHDRKSKRQNKMAKRKVICGIQQVGIGVNDADKCWAWYRDIFGVDVKMVGDVKGVCDAYA